jgi:ribosome-associated protein
MKTPFVKDFQFEILFQAQRSRGPGGQNVNKTNSSVQLRWAFGDSLLLSVEQKHIIDKKLQSFINSEGILYIRSDVHREFENNKREVLEKLQKLLTAAFHKPKVRRPTKPTYSSKQKKLKTKKHRSEIKKARQTKWE